ncbi:MAG: hypothetical protein WA817_20605 [Candidatus Acidiferrum sp.]
MRRDFIAPKARGGAAVLSAQASKGEERFLATLEMTGLVLATPVKAK